MIALLAILGCAGGPKWTEAGAVAPTLARMDRDHDGEVAAAEYDAVRFRGPDFSVVDADGDRALSDAELLALVLEKDPTMLSPTRPTAAADANKRRPQARPGKGPGGKVEDRPADPAQLRAEAAAVVKSVLLALKAEIRAVAPNQATPTDDVIKAAAATADLRTAESRGVLAELEAASDAVGVAFPASLRAAALANEPVVPSAHVEEAREKPRVQLGPDGNPVRPGAKPGEPGPPGGPPVKPGTGRR